MIPLYSTNQIREIDNFAINDLGVPSIVLMENASIQIFDAIQGELIKSKKIKKISAVCGKGNNGGDGFAVLRHFANSGFRVVVIHVGKEHEMTEDCRINFRILRKMAISNSNIIIQEYNSLKDLALIANSQIILDCMLGSGAEGELREPYKEIVKSLNKLKAVRIAIDIPTGLDADLGTGKTIFDSDFTITLGDYKKGLFIEQGYANCGNIIKGDIGIDPIYFEIQRAEDYLIEPEDVLESLPVKKKNIHKYSAGKVLTIAGSGSFPGAAVLASKSALKAGAGASILAFPKSVRNLVHKKLGEVVVQAYEDQKKEYLSVDDLDNLSERIKWADVTAIGPGLGRNKETQTAVLKILAEKKCNKFVIDADAIFALGSDNYQNIDLKNFVLTPHHGEFANLINVSVNELNAGLFRHCKEFVKRTGAYLVLKGAPTIIFNPEGEALINSAGNPGMAKFGTGDVLTGVIAGLLSQQKDIEKSVIAGVYLHSLAADLLAAKKTEYSYTAEDIIKSLPSSFNFIKGSFV
jgi:ADP-dependent NAD(P)H-hydrate dehydratase / NAD(P)H-hydrate epimerase